MRFTVKSPASSANLGPGFDALGLALDLWSEVIVDTDGEPGAILLDGAEAKLLEGRENLTLTAMRRLAEARERRLPPFAMTVRTGVPVARGLGSSATALVAGLVAANHLLDLRLTPAELYTVAWRMEGHGDNVGASLYGGAVLAMPTRHEIVHLSTGDDLGLVAVIFVPEMTGATWAARAALPATIPHTDATYTLATAAGLVLGLRMGDHALIAAGMHDRLHEPYRARLFPHLQPLADAARHSGALGACLSGAGPSVLALVEPDRAAAVASAYCNAARRLGVGGDVLSLAPATHGAHVVEAASPTPAPTGRVASPVGF